MARKNLSAKKRMNMISGPHIRFDKLKTNTGVLSGALPAQIAFAPPPRAPAVLPKVLAENEIGPDIAFEMDKKMQDEEEESCQGRTSKTQ